MTLRTRLRRAVKLTRRAIWHADLPRRIFPHLRPKPGPGGVIQFKSREPDGWLGRAYDWLRWGPPEE